MVDAPEHMAVITQSVPIVIIQVRRQMHVVPEDHAVTETVVLKQSQQTAVHSLHQMVLVHRCQIVKKFTKLIPPEVHVAQQKIGVRVASELLVRVVVALKQQKLSAHKQVVNLKVQTLPVQSVATTKRVLTYVAQKLVVLVILVLVMVTAKKWDHH